MTDSAVIPSPIAVTGASGYIGSWIVKLLLEQGATVHATVRDLTCNSKVEHLREIAVNCPGTLKLFEADLVRPGCFDEPFRGCEAVIHSASPFLIGRIADPLNQLMVPAVTGTRHVLEAVERSPLVTRVVLTSSVVAIYGDTAEAITVAGRTFTEAHWNNSSSLGHQPYSYSKTQAEREAWSFADRQERWRLVTVNPGLVLGPALSQRTDSTSVDLILQLLDGRLRSGVPDLIWGAVDVREVAQAHVAAVTRPEAQGRHILVAESISYPKIAALLREYMGGGYPIPKNAIPKAILYMIAPFVGMSRQFVKRNVGIPIQFDNTKSKSCLGIDYRPIRETIVDQVSQLRTMGLIGSASN